MRRWDRDEIEWAVECAAAGDSLDDIAEMAGCPVAEVKAALAGLAPLTYRQRMVAQLYVAGETYSAIGRALGSTARNSQGVAVDALRRIRAKGYPVPGRLPQREPRA